VHFCVITTDVLREKGVIVWVRGYLQSRTKHGAYNCLMRDLQVHAEDELKHYMRMDLSTFEELYSLVE